LTFPTGYGGDDDHRLSRETGFDEHLTKPVELPVLAFPQKSSGIMWPPVLHRCRDFLVREMVAT
jgi:hypothetical protein